MKCRRNFYRIDFLLSAIYTPQLDISQMDEWDWHDCLIANLSLGGASIITKEERKSGEQLWLEFNLDTNNILCNMLVCHVEKLKTETSHSYKLGVQFSNILENDKNIIARYVAKYQMKEMRSKGANQA
ncbi:flagellar brake protein [Heliorestis acidaminivorans]|nr:PilZ domain-containing protein [Heliorestis acidaminivorans]